MKNAVASLNDFQLNFAERVRTLFARNQVDFQQWEVQPIASHPRLEMPKWPYAG